MTYFITFLEGLITFISPCLLPMLPIYLSYFAAGREDQGRWAAFRNALGFVLGFTLMFVAMGAFAGTIGAALARHQRAVNLVSGGLVVLFGLSFLDILPLPLFRGIRGGARRERMSFFSAVLFGLVFAVGWTPCVGAFLGSALMLASQQGSTLRGVLLLLSYSAGLGIPFLASALLIQSLKNAFGYIKAHYRQINLACGILLILLGLAMASGTLGRLLSALA